MGKRSRCVCSVMLGALFVVQVLCTDSAVHVPLSCSACETVCCLSCSYWLVLDKTTTTLSMCGNGRKGRFLHHHGDTMTRCVGEGGGGWEEGRQASVLQEPGKVLMDEVMSVCLSVCLSVCVSCTQVLDAQFNPYAKNALVTCGVKHIKFWKLCGNSLTAKKGIFGKAGTSVCMCAHWCVSVTSGCMSV